MDLAGNEPAGCRVPGSFGNELEAAVLQYQRDHVLTADGIARRLPSQGIASLDTVANRWL